MEGWIEGIVVENKRWNERLCSLRVEAPFPMFEAGQFTRLGLEVDGEMLARPYSLVSAPGEAVAEFYFNKVLDGPLSTLLHRLNAGDKIWLSQLVAGFLTVSDIPEGKNLWMLSTGTALGPFLSILQVGEVWQKFDQVVLVHGVRSVAELTYLGLIDDVKKAYPDRFTPIASITREQVAGTISDRIPAAITSGELERRAGLEMTPEEDRVMLCGSPGMVEGCLEALSEKGLHRHRRKAPGQVIMEIYK